MTKKIGEIGRTAPTPTSLPDPGDTELSFDKEEDRYQWDGVDANAEIRTGTDTCFGTPA